MSFEYQKLRGKIKEVYGTQEDFAEALSMSKVSLSQKLNGHSFFSQREINQACELLKIDADNLKSYFFTVKVQKTEHIQEEE